MCIPGSGHAVENTFRLEAVRNWASAALEIVKVELARLPVFIEEFGGTLRWRTALSRGLGLQFALRLLFGFLRLPLAASALSFALLESLTNWH
jgi:hypothetical protein